MKRASLRSLIQMPQEEQKSAPRNKTDNGSVKNLISCETHIQTVPSNLTKKVMSICSDPCYNNL